MIAALLLRDDSRMTMAITEAARALKTQALEKAALIGKVTNAAEQETACEAQKDLTELLGQIEKARVAAKDPVLNFGRLIDSTARTFVEDLKAEQLRIAQLVANFQQLERQRIQAAQQAENDRLVELEREKAAELAKAKTMDEVDKVQEQFNNRAQAEAVPIPQATRAANQRVSEEWTIEVTDIWMLARAHPTCVKMEPLKSEIKGLLNAGVKVAGVRASKEVVSRVSGFRPKAIEV